MDSTLQLPLWLAKSLGERRHVELQLPKHYDVQYRNALKADAAVLDLNRCSGYYFDVGMQLARLCMPTLSTAAHGTAPIKPMIFNCALPSHLRNASPWQEG